MDDRRIEQLKEDDAGELMTLRRAAFVTEAQTYDDPHLPALRQTLNEVRRELEDENIVILGARHGHRLVGSIMVKLEGVRASLASFAVAPDQQGAGVGTELLLAIPSFLPEGTEEIWVATPDGVEHDISSFSHEGIEHQYGRQVENLTVAYMRKIFKQFGTE